MIYRYKFLIAIIVVILLGSCVRKEQAIPVVPEFEVEVIDQDYTVPVKIRLRNTTTGAEEYHWSFQGGNPKVSDQKNPGVINYEEAGEYEIVMKGWNTDGNEGEQRYTLKVDSLIQADFEVEFVVNNLPPAEICLTNLSKGANRYNWQFEGGLPESDGSRTPSGIVFNEPGEHTITFECSNGRETKSVSQTVNVGETLTAGFDIRPELEDQDMEVPVHLVLENQSRGAISYEWHFPGGDPVSSTLANPEVVYHEPGSYELELIASNGKITRKEKKQIIVKPNTNLRVFSSLKLGVYSAHSKIGSFFSTQKQSVFTSSIKWEEEPFVDIVFFGLNEDFEYSRFVSPDQASEYAFSPLQKAETTTFVNVLESSEVVYSDGDFENLKEGDQLKDLQILANNNSDDSFDASLVPRIVLFQTQDKRKGVIRINQFVKEGEDSYILMDLKVQKKSY